MSETGDSWPFKFPHREYEEAHSLRYRRILIEKLENLQKASDPAGGDETAMHKDELAFEALSTAMSLVEHFAGWAIDHQLGLAAAGLEFVPFQPTANREHPDYLAQRQMVNTHEHESVGGRAYYGKRVVDSAVLKRQAILNLLLGMSSRSTTALFEEMREALRALDYGETLPILKPQRSGKKAKFRALKLQLKAIGFVEYQVALGVKKKKAQEIVATAYGLGDDAIRNWETRLRDQKTGIGALKVSREIIWARNAASYVEAARQGSDRDRLAAERSEQSYGHAAIQAAGAEFKEVQWEREE